MKLGTFLILACIAYIGFGAGLLIAPGPFMSTYGLSLDEGGMLMSRVLGASLIGFTLVFWWSRNAPSSEALLAVLRASLIYNVLDLPTNIIAIQSGLMNTLAWSAVILHVLLAIGFGYFGFVKR